MRKFYDSTDIANDVMKSLAARFDNYDFSSIDSLRAFLIHAAEQKVIDEYRKVHAQKRDVNRERPIYGGEDGFYRQLIDGSPTPSQLAVATEEKERLLGAQNGEGQKILEMKFAGHSSSEVARETGLHLRKVERFIESLRGKCRL